MENIDNFDYLLDDNLIEKMCESYKKEGIECSCVTQCASFVQARKRVIARINAEIIFLLHQIEKTVLGMKNQYDINLIAKYKNKYCCIERGFKKSSISYINLVSNILLLEKKVLLELNNLKDFNVFDVEKEQLIFSIMQSWAIEYFVEYSKNGVC